MAKGFSRLSKAVAAAFLTTALAGCATPKYGEPRSESLVLAEQLEDMGINNGSLVGFYFAPLHPINPDHEKFEEEKAILLEATRKNPQAVMALAIRYQQALEAHNSSTDTTFKAAATREMTRIKIELKDLAKKPAPDLSHD